MNVLVTGSSGFIGKNLVSCLQSRPDVHAFGFDLEHTREELDEGLALADLVYHLAGVNRPQAEDGFQSGNVELTACLCDRLLHEGRETPIVLSSSIQAVLDNAYGASKREAEAVVTRYAEQSGASVLIYRLRNVFGKWCRPNYNSVVATFCHNIAHSLPLSISDPDRELELIYVDDVVDHFASELESDDSGGVHYREVSPHYRVRLGELAELIGIFRRSRDSLYVPDMAGGFVHKLYATYLSYLAPDSFAYSLDQKCDSRGVLAEFVKSGSFGQIFISRTAPGVTRGNHYHQTKTEKFLVLDGEAVIRFRHILGREVVEYHVQGEDFRVLDIPPGYTHSIENVGEGELVTLFWASEIFNPERPDTGFLPVITEESSSP